MTVFIIYDNRKGDNININSLLEKRGVQEFYRKFVSTPADKAADNVLKKSKLIRCWREQSRIPKKLIKKCCYC